MHRIVAGAIAGAAGTTALNVATYLDMLVRGRAASETPAKVAGDLASAVHLPLGRKPKAAHRREAAGALLGYATGVGIGAGWGAVARAVPVPAAATLLAVSALVAGDLPATALGITHPRRWTRTSWLEDAIPHMAYGLVAAAISDRLTTQ